MPQVNELEYTVAYSLEDTFTYTRVRELPYNLPGGLNVNDGLLLQNDSDSWNCTIEANDKMYSNLVTEDDLISFHFQFNDPITDTANLAAALAPGGTFANWLYYAGRPDSYISVDMLDVNGSVVRARVQSISDSSFVAYSPDGFFFQNVRFNDNWQDCFYFKISVLQPDLTTWATYFTEPFRKVNCEKTVLLRGYYESGYDNFGFYYGQAKQVGANRAYLGDTDLPHHLQMRLEGELIHDGYSLTHTQVDGETITSQQNEVYRLILAPVPPYQAKRLANLLAAPYFTIDGITFTRAKTIQKNNPDGNMWHIDLELERDNTELNFDCN